MVTLRSVASSAGAVFACLLFSFTAGCRTVEPVTVYPSFTVSPALAAKAPTQVAVLPVEDGTASKAATPYLVFLRQELQRQLVTRLYSPIHTPKVDASLRGSAVAQAANASGSVLDPTWLRQAAAATAEECTLAVRIDRWDESKLLINRRVSFQFQAALVDRSGDQLWFGTLAGEIKAGGAGAAPRDRNYMARSCGELAVRELLLRLPSPNRAPR
ncbi:MAG: hypothetical protein NXI31_13110 [bacterium]|nr:hypothetical protein [bacterium]